jgi:DNA-binding transcriptional regulator/RsmH inhibitor MraZ
MGDRVELWNPDAYDQYMAQSDQTVESILEEFLTRPPQDQGESGEETS